MSTNSISRDQYMQIPIPTSPCTSKNFQATGFLLTKRACFTGRFSLFKGLVHVTVRRWTSKLHKALQLLGLRPSPWKQLWLKPNIEFIWGKWMLYLSSILMSWLWSDFECARLCVQLQGANMCKHFLGRSANFSTSFWLAAAMTTQKFEGNVALKCKKFSLLNNLIVCLVAKSTCWLSKPQNGWKWHVMAFQNISPLIRHLKTWTKRCKQDSWARFGTRSHRRAVDVWGMKPEDGLLWEQSLVPALLDNHHVSSIFIWKTD